MVEWFFSSIKRTKLFFVIGSIFFFYFSYLAFDNYSQIEKVKRYGKAVEAKIISLPNRCWEGQYYEIIFKGKFFKLETKKNVCVFLKNKMVGDVIILVYLFDKKDIFIIPSQNNIFDLISAIGLFLFGLMGLVVVLSNAIDKQLSDD